MQETNFWIRVLDELLEKNENKSKLVIAEKFIKT